MSELAPLVAPLPAKAVSPVAGVAGVTQAAEDLADPLRGRDGAEATAAGPGDRGVAPTDAPEGGDAARAPARQATAPWYCRYGKKYYNPLWARSYTSLSSTKRSEGSRANRARRRIRFR